MPTRVVLIRHAEPEVPAAREGVLSPGQDIPLSAAGRRQASRLARCLGNAADRLCLSSPLRRAMETAEIAVAASGARFEIDPCLREIEFGEWDGLTFEEMARRDPERIAGWAACARDFAFPGGERLGDFLDRVALLAGRLGSHDRPVILISHAGVIRALLCRLLGLEPRHYLLFGVDHASITQVDLFGDRGVLVRLNDTCHLDAH